MIRVMSLNIWKGGGDRWPAILELVGEVRPDALILQECSGWEEEPSRLREVAGRLGAKEAVLAPSGRLHKGLRFNVAGLTLRSAEAVRIHNDPRFIERAAVELVLPGLTVLGAHLTVEDESKRCEEMHWLTRGVAPPTAPTLLVGDLNSLSRRDPYPADFDARLERVRVDKYGHPPRFDVTGALEADGWIDTLYQRGAPSRWITAPRESEGVRYDSRLDYGFASSSLASRVRLSRVLAGEVSDHYAILVEVDE
jgi:exodeoxyribonuclease-3